MIIKVLTIGDIVGQEALGFVCHRLNRLKKETEAALVIANGENVSPGNGLDPGSANTLFNCGVDVITSGNHIWHRREIKEYLDDTQNVLRPANYPAVCPGSGFTVVEAQGIRFLVVNVMGNVYMDPPLACPFATVERILDHMAGRYDIGILDIHAEATSEKNAIARYFDARVGAARLSAVFGTHTHVQTADETILPGGCGYITDIGMTGPTDSVLGIRTGLVLDKLRFKMPVKFEVAEGDIALCGAVFSFDTETMKAVAVERIRVAG